MSIRFKSVVEKARFLDPQNGFEENLLPFEIRIDPLTGHTSRVLDFRFKLPQRPDLSELVSASKKGCPFCEENYHKVTPKFPGDIIPEGRISLGKARIFPNLMPYDTYSAVGIFSFQHFLDITDFSQELLQDGLLAALSYLKRVKDYDPAIIASSINWNYMPLAGAALLHPHLQMIASSRAPRHQKDCMDNSFAYRQRNGNNYWSDLIDQEKKTGERYVGTTGDVVWLTCFAPKGIIPDIMALFSERGSVVDLKESDLADFSRGLIKIFHYLDDQDFYGFNLAVYLGWDRQESFWIHARVIPRLVIPPLNSSDINYLKLLHDEAFTVKKPETVCKELRHYFS